MSIGNKRLEMPDCSTAAVKLLLDFDVEISHTDNMDTEMRYACRLVELNNEVYDKNQKGIAACLACEYHNSKLNERK